jgi:hypothetical protein
MSRYLIQTDKEVSVTERAALYLLDEPVERSDLANLSVLDKNPSLCPVGSVEFVQAWIRHLGLVEPKPIDYPFSLYKFLGREVWMAQGVHLLLVSSFPLFVKPVATKAWTGRVLTRDSDLTGLDGPVLVSDVVQFNEEFRVYVLKQGTDSAKILFVGRYDNLDCGLETPPLDVISKANEMIQVFERGAGDHSYPCAYALDIGITDSGRVLLVEVTDAWAVGLYKPDTGIYPGYRKDYFNWLHARWEQIVAESTGQQIFSEEM